MRNLWEEIANKCLNEALKKLTETALTEEQVKTVKELVDIAISIEKFLR